MIIVLCIAIFFGIIQGINAMSGPPVITHTDNLFEYIFDTRHKI